MQHHWFNDALARQPDYADAIIAGDMNADCTYVYNPTQDLTLYKDPTSSWLLNFDVDTTVKLWRHEFYCWTIAYQP